MPASYGAWVRCARSTMTRPRAAAAGHAFAPNLCRGAVCKYPTVAHGGFGTTEDAVSVVAVSSVQGRTRVMSE
jgi:hypothetical protein